MTPDGSGKIKGNRSIVIEVPLHLLKITLLDRAGNPATEETPLWELSSFRFKVEGPGFDSNKVTKLTLPTLDYSRNDLPLAKVEVLCFKDDSQGD